MPKMTIAVKVTATATPILPANPKRLAYTIINNDSVDIVLGSEQGMTYDQGEPLPAGSAVSDDVDQEAVYGMSTYGSVDIRVTEIEAAS
jgi:hypothetical protein